MKCINSGYFLVHTEYIFGERKEIFLFEDYQQHT
jgi:hypothetical protein